MGRTNTNGGAGPLGLCALALAAATVVAPLAGAANRVHFWTFNDSTIGGNPAVGTDPSVDQTLLGAPATFQGGAHRTAGLIGPGAAFFDNVAGTSANVGSTGFAFTTGVAVEAVIAAKWTGNSFDYDEIFRKEDGGNRILLSFQNDPNNPGAQPSVAPGAVLSFGLNIAGAYNELDMPLDGQAGRPTLAQMTTGNHHVVAQYDSLTGRKSIWIDGTERYGFTLPAGSLMLSGGGAVASIGNTGPGSNEPWNGVIDEVAIYDGALTAAEIGAHYANVQAGRDYDAVPEPSSVAVMVLGGLANAARRRRK